MTEQDTFDRIGIDLKSIKNWIQGFSRDYIGEARLDGQAAEIVDLRTAQRTFAQELGKLDDDKKILQRAHHGKLAKTQTALEKVETDLKAVQCLGRTG